MRRVIPSPKKQREALLTAAQKSASREKTWSRLSPEEKLLYRDAMNKNWSKFLKNKAVEVIPPKDAMAIRQKAAKSNSTVAILPSRFVKTDKNEAERTPTNPLPILASSRWVVQGFKDKLLLSLRTDAPTVHKTTIALICQYAASMSWKLSAADVEAAFLKADEQDRELYAEVPPEGLPGVPAGSLIRLLKAVFGQGDAPRRWYQKLSKAAVAKGFRVSQLDPCLFMLEKFQGEKLVLHGMFGSHVDDLLSAGDDHFYDIMHELDEEVGFGSFKYYQFKYCGRMYSQNEKTFEVTVDMKPYTENLTTVKLTKEQSNRN